MKLMKRVFAFAMMLCLLMVCVVPTEAMAAPNYKGKKQTFKIRWSDGYGLTGVTVTMKSTSADGKKGTITFNSTFDTKKFGHQKLLKGVVYNYTISSLKEGGTITLKYDEKENGAMSTRQLYTLTGKIHIDKTKNCSIANIWKIDTLKYGDLWGLKHKIGFYFRND